MKRRAWNSTLPAPTKPLRRSSMPRGGKLKAKGGSRFPKRRDDVYRAWIRTLPCVVASPYCFGHVEAAHVGKTRGAGAWDRGFCVPLCFAHHTEQEGRTKKFNATYRVDLEAIAAELAA